MKRQAINRSKTLILDIFISLRALQKVVLNNLYSSSLVTYTTIPLNIMNSNSSEPAKVSNDPFFSPTLQLILKGTHFPTPSYLKLYQNSSLDGTNWTLSAATEINDSNPHPVYKNAIQLKYLFPVNQIISIEVWRVSIGFNNLFGSIKFNLVQLLRSPIKSIELPIDLSVKKGLDSTPYIKVTIDEALESKDVLSATFGAKLYKRFLFVPKTYFSLWKSLDNGPYSKVLQSQQVISNNPVWPQTLVKVSNQFKQGGKLRLAIHDKSDKILGYSEFTFADLMDPKKKSFDLVKMENNKNSETEAVDQGTIELIDRSLEKAMTFTEFLTLGLEIQYSAIIDFSSLCKEHERNEEDVLSLHDYKEAVRLVTSIIGNYLDENEISAFGVGTKKEDTHGRGYFLLKEDKKLTTSNSKALLVALDECLKSLEGKKDIRILPPLREVMKKVKTDMVLSHKPKYYVCALFLFDEIKDLQRFIDQIVLMSYAIPVSFMILGLGSKASNQFRVLKDEIEQLKDSRNRQIQRENVKFVCLNEYSNLPKAVAQLLEELPKPHMGHS